MSPTSANPRPFTSVWSDLQEVEFSQGFIQAGPALLGTAGGVLEDACAAGRVQSVRSASPCFDLPSRPDVTNPHYQPLADAGFLFR